MGREYFNTAGAGTWTVPAGVRKVRVELTGAGAPGTLGTAGASTGGGGAGAYTRTNALAVVPGAALSFQVGDAAGNRDSWFSSVSTVLAKGGALGSGTLGGAGGTAASGIGDVKFSGGNGGNGTGAANSGGGGGGSSAGPASSGNNGANNSGTGGGAGGAAVIGGAGGAGGTSPNGAGTAGSAPGGGGGGGATSNGPGGAGGNGFIVLTYDQIDPNVGIEKWPLGTDALGATLFCSLLNVGIGPYSAAQFFGFRNTNIITGNAFNQSTDTSQFFNYVAFQDPPALNNEWEIGFYLSRGYYRIYLLGKKSSDSGIVTLRREKMDDSLVLIGTLDWYNATTQNNIIQNLVLDLTGDMDAGTVSAGWHVIHGQMADKNASSSDYKLTLTGIWIAPQVQEPVLPPITTSALGDNIYSTPW